MPLGAFVANKLLMDAFTGNPVLGHITTFGGHPVCCAAGMAAMEVLLEEKWIEEVTKKEELFRSLLVHPKIKKLHSFGLWLAVEFASFEENKKVIDACLQASGRSGSQETSSNSNRPDAFQGVMTDWFLFASNCLRISPPLCISAEEIREACAFIVNACNE